MARTKSKFKSLKYFMFLFLGFILGVGAIWPGLITENGRICFFKIIKDGSDGSVSVGTIFSLNPNYLMEINNAKNKYNKALLVGDFCFRKF